ncbi:MAG TPA: OPT family oligopeptide transporter [Polyangiaceae bacterium]|nr:OPT family oligopeptide transporter [Polyangiaceae bacterium]
MTEAKNPDPDQEWLKNVYRGGIRQLTPRAVVAGMLLGAVMCLSNLYVVLKTGWSLAVTVTACILGFGLFRALRAIGLSRTPFTLLENSAVGSVAAAAGYMTGGGNMAAVPALLLLTGMRPTPWAMFWWFAVIAAMGVCAAIPIKRELVNAEQLPFPTGTATAETLLSLHSADGEGAKARLLGWAGVIGASLAWLRDAKAAWMPFNLRSSFPFPFSYGGHPAAQWTMTFDGSLILLGSGAIVGFRTGWSMLLGAVLTYGFLAPSMFAADVIKTVSYKGIMQFTLWPGAAMLISSALLSFLLRWRSIVKSFSGLSLLTRKRGVTEQATREADAIAAVECPDWWFPAGYAVLSPIVITLMQVLFGIPWWAGLVTIPLSIVMGIVAARVTGETDTTPTKALGPVTQSVFGALLPGNLAANLMGANVTGGVGLHAADLLTDLKTGYLVGANPRQQFFAQLFGVLAGAAAVVPVFNLLVPNPEVLGSPEFPAPAVQVWAGVSKVLVDGVSALHPAARGAAAIAFLLGIALVLTERWAPRKLRPFVPSPSGLGIAMVIPGYNSIAMFLGGFIAEVLRRKRPALAERAIVPVASGFIAGESLMGVLIAVLIALGILGR